MNNSSFYLVFASQLVRELTCNYANKIILFLHPGWILNSMTKRLYSDYFFSFGNSLNLSFHNGSSPFTGLHVKKAQSFECSWKASVNE